MGDQTDLNSEQDIAIVGMALRFPGASNPREFWENLRDGVESIRSYSDEELVEAGVSPSQIRNPHYVKAGAPLDEMEYFDAEFFGFSPKEGGILDPQHRQFYECAWEALEDAGHPPENFDGAIGVFGGCGMGAYFAFNLITNPELVNSVGMFLLRHTGNDKDFLSSRVSYSFDLKGPSVNVQTACSTSLVATHMACQSLLSGESDMALAGGSTIEIPHRVGYLYKEGEILSPDGHCRAFDHRSKGTVFGSGTGIVVLRRLEDALEDGDNVYAVIKGTAINNDGSGKVGYLAPSVDGQAAAIVEALAVADVDADSIGYVECHGTGTPVGDPIEVSALTQAFRETSERNGFCGIGSVKTNIGHLDTAAGVASLIKATLALRHGQRPPSLNYEAPNPTIDFTNSPFYVNDSLGDWQPGESRRRAGVNSLGVGGTNAFAVLEEFPQPETRTGMDTGHRHLPIVLSARNRKALDGQCRKLAAYLRDQPECWSPDLAYTLLEGRRRFEHRRVMAAADPEEAVELLESNDIQRVFTVAHNGDRAPVVFLFPGGGAQYLGMGRDLYRHNPVFRKHVDMGISLLKSRSGFNLAPLILEADPADESAQREFETPSVQLPAIFIIEFALAQLWKSLGIEPVGLIGHSMGENTAACVAGVLSFEDALGLVRLRGELMDAVPAGGMLSVELPAAELEAYLSDGLDLASVNSPELSVATGPEEDLVYLATELTKAGIESKRIRINIAAHSRMLEGILQPFGDYLRSVTLNPPEIPFVSNRTGTWITNDQATDPDYWVSHLRNTVRFSDGVETLLEDEDSVLLEVGPGQTLSSLAKQQGNAIPQRIFASMRRYDETVDDQAFLMTILGRIWACGATLDPAAIWPDHEPRRISLPTYAFQRSRYWIEPGKAHPTATPDFGQLEKLENFDEWFHEPVWIQQGILADAQTDTSCWLLFVDGSGYGEELEKRLSTKGHDVVTVREGDAYYKLNNNDYRLSPEMGAEGYQALVRDLVASGKTPDRILHLWQLTESESFRPGSSFFHRNQEHGFYSLFFLARALGSEEISMDGMHWIVVSNGMQRVADEALPYPEKSTLLGPCGVIPREFAGTTCVSIDIDLPHVENSFFRKPNKPDANRGRLIDMLEVELATRPMSGIVAYRNGVRWEQRYQPAADIGSVGGTLLKQNGVYLVTGGLGGIGFTLAQHLAASVSARLVLVNRTPLPDRPEWGRWLKRHEFDDPISRGIRHVQALEKAGAEVLVQSGDVTNLERMRQIVEETRTAFGPINGVFHAAGVVRDNLIQVKSQSEIEEVFAPKIYGTLVLDELLNKEHLDFILLYSSTSTVITPMGQVDYVAANAFLNAYAQSHAGRQDRKTIAVNWGIWNEVGMAANAASKMGFGAQKETVAPINHNTRHPLFEKRLTLIENELRTHLLSTHISPRSHWLLDEHRTSDGEAIFPGTGYIELVRAALKECDETGRFQIRDLFFLRPLRVADDESREVRIRLTTSSEGYRFVVHSEAQLADGTRGWERHAEARILMAPPDEPETPAIDDIAERCGIFLDDDSDSWLRSGQEDHLQFGPRWKVLQQVGYGDGEALGNLLLADRFVDDLSDFQLHPGLLDLATGFAMELIEGYAKSEKARNLWVPVSYGAIRYYRPLTQRIRSHVRNHGKNTQDGEFARFDITITDSDGNVLVQVNELTIRKLEDSGSFGRAPEPGIGEVESDEASDGTGEVRQLSPAEQVFQHNLTQGILPDEGMRAIDRLLSDASGSRIIVSSLDLDGLVAETDAVADSQGEASSSKFSRPELDSDFVEARDDIERKLVAIWEELLGVDQVGVQDSFFDLGGHSLVAVRLFARIKQTFDVDYPISILFEAPTIEGCANLIRTEIGDQEAGSNNAGTNQKPETRYTHLVPMHPGSGRNQTPFFLVAGMFGNVLNLRHLAQLVGSDRPFYGLQARGLYGDQDPHETFEDMARDYIAEMRTVQKSGPYLLGGFSGGGITAYEIARQLREDGEDIALLVMLDTPLPQAPPLSSVDRMSIHWQRLRNKGASYFAEWAKNRYQWELRKFRKRFEEDENDSRPYDFQSEGMEVAFRRALDRYQLSPQPIPITLFRPRLDTAYQLSGNRVANTDREVVYHDNGWSPYVSTVKVIEVPGDHDSMVLEPNVRVLASELRATIDQSQAKVGKYIELAS